MHTVKISVGILLFNIWNMSALYNWQYVSDHNGLQDRGPCGRTDNDCLLLL